MNKIIFTIVFGLLLVLTPNPVVAVSETICTTSYGGGTVCGAKTHEPIEAGLAENLALIGGLSIGISAFLQKLSKNTKKLVTNA